MQYVDHETIGSRYVLWCLEIADIRVEYDISDLLLTHAAICWRLEVSRLGENVPPAFKGVRPHK